MDWLIQVDKIAVWLENFGIWAILISLLINILTSILGIIPSLFLSGANAIVFGLIPGFWISLIGEVLGAGISYWLYRWGFGKLKLVSQERWGWLKKLNEASRMKRITVLFLGRLTPLLPSGVITFAAAVSNMRFIDFFFVTLIGKVPSIALETLVGHDMIRLNENYPRLLFSLLFIVLIYVLFKNKQHSKEKGS
jgi:uncharacterized membrane protein YdjX (TVP38/TMEM64 family)